MASSKLKGFSKDALLYGVGDVLGRISNLLLLPILSRIFTASDYGIIDLLTVSYTFLLILIKFGVPTGLQRFYYNNECGERKLMVTSSIGFLFIGSVIMALLLYSISGLLSKTIEGDPQIVEMAIIVLTLCLPIELLWNCLVLLLRLNRRAVTFSIVNIVFITLTISITYYLVAVLNYGLYGVFIAKLTSLVIVTIFLLANERHEFLFKMDFSVFRKVFLFAIPGLPALIIKHGMNILPRYMLAFFAPMSAVGLYGISFRIASILQMYVTAFNMAWNPFAYANEGAADERRLYEIIFKVFAASLVLAGMMLSLFARELLSVMTPSSYHSAYFIVPGIVFYLAVEGLVIIFSTLLYTNGKVRWASYLSGIQLIVFLIAGIFLVPRFEAIGVVLAMDIAAIVYFSAYAYITLNTFYFNIPALRLIPLLLLAAVVILFFNTYNMDFLTGMIVKIVIFSGIFALTPWVVLNIQERKQITRMLKTKHRFFS